MVDILHQSLCDLGYKVALAGNFGTPVLSLLNEDFDYVVLELSSFQLESTYHLSPLISCVLNVTPDHIDRHGDLERYAQAKQRIFKGAQHVIFNRDDKLSYPTNSQHQIDSVDTVMHSFGEEEPALHTLLQKSYHTHQAPAGIFEGQTCVLDVQKLHNNSHYQLLNLQVVLICLNILDIDIARAKPSLYAYKNLEHRFQTVHESAGCRWINDSKATNPGATLAAIKNLLQQPVTIILLAGGDAKGADLSNLLRVIEQSVNHLILFGKNARLFTAANTPYALVDTMYQAVMHADKKAQALLQSGHKNVVVLLSPACASIDMFSNYQDRGMQFVDALHAVIDAPEHDATIGATISAEAKDEQYISTKRRQL